MGPLEKEDAPFPEHVPVKDPEPDTKTVHGSTAFSEAMLKEPPNAWSKPQVMIFLFSIVGFFCSTMNGYDGSLINNLLQNPSFREQFRVENDGLGAGFLASVYQIGGVATLPLIGPAVDTWGRRVGMLIGGATVIVGTCIQGASQTNAQYLGGRFLLGVGVAVAVSAGPMYVVELNHPAYRGRVGALYNTLWFVGAIMAAGAARGAIEIEGETSWRLITWLQAFFSGLIVLFSLLVPESPRWLFVNGKRDQARDILAKYHGNGNPESVWVTLQLREYEELLVEDGTDKRWWDYRALLRDRASVYRLCCNLILATFAQCAGNAVLSYFLGSVLDTAGYTRPVEQTNITLINSCQQFAFAIFGSLFVDKLGRRPLMLFAFTGCTVVWLGMTVASSALAKSQSGIDSAGKPVFENTAASRACLAMVFIFGSVYSVGITPIQALYPVEVLSFEMRAKGMAINNLAINLAGLVNQFAWPVAMQRLGWKTYIFFTIWDAIQVIVIYLVLPETKGRTLEELDEVFMAKNPVKASVAVKAVAIDSGNNAHAVLEA